MTANGAMISNLEPLLHTSLANKSLLYDMNLHEVCENTSYSLEAEPIGQGGQVSTHFCAQWASIHHFSASKLIFLPFHTELIRIIMHVTIMMNNVHGVAS